MAGLLHILLVAILCQVIIAGPVRDAVDDEDFETYKKIHPEEFGTEFEGDIIEDDNFRNGIINKRLIWPRGEVFYVLDPNARFNSGEVANINAAIADFKRYTCVKWMKRTNQQSYVKIYRGGGCSSAIGMSSSRGRPQNLSLGRGCTGKATIIHEMLHAVGFVHEQCRTDRDDHITINWNNIQSNMKFNFNKHGSNYISLLNTPYDYDSVMHYGRRAFSANGRDTIVPRKQGAQIGQRRGFSKVDIERVNKLYNCQGGGGSGEVLPTQPPITSTCSDDHSNCRYWQSIGECFKNPRYMLNVCKKSCRQC